MKVKSKVEFLIHVKSYRNIDFMSFEEGLYHLRFSIFQQNKQDYSVKIKK
jgi:hypothetical protein